MVAIILLMHPVLEYVTEQLGRRPRQFRHEIWRTLMIPEPSWAAKDDMGVIFRDQRFLYKEGEVVWAAYVQANVLLFRRGVDNCPGTFIYSRHPDIDDDPGLLDEIAERLGELKHRDSARQDERRYGDMLRDERMRAMRWLAPERLTDGLPVYSTSIMVCRRHIPERVLARRVVPILRHRDTVATLIVPRLFWPDRFRDTWADAAARATAGQPWVTIEPEAADYVRQLAREKRLPEGWCLRLEYQYSEDGMTQRVAWDLFLSCGEANDRVFEVSGIRVAIRDHWVDDFRGVEIRFVEDGGQKGLGMR
jgi:hypothetical protein